MLVATPVIQGRILAKAELTPSQPLDSSTSLVSEKKLTKKIKLEWLAIYRARGIEVKLPLYRLTIIEPNSGVQQTSRIYQGSLIPQCNKEYCKAGNP